MVFCRTHRRAPLLWLALCAAAGLFGPALCNADREKKEKPEKVAKVEPWVELRAPHFLVTSDGGEKTARRIAEQFERVRHVFEATMPGARLDTGLPTRILAAHDGSSFATLFPEFPATDKHRTVMQPTGQFIPGPEANYIALRTNISGPLGYQEIYQEYARLILKRSYRNLPPWLEEGYANAFGSMSFSDKGASLGRPDPEDMSVLFESPLLPLDLVFHVDRSSAYYNPGSRTTVYFAESRALVHYLLTDPQAPSMSIGRYIALVEGGADPLQAARQSFGDLNQMQAKLEAYIKQTGSSPSEIPGTGASASISSPPHTLTPAETDALLGDFAFNRGKFDRAQEKLEDAIKLDPSLASAEQSLGYLLLRERHDDEAEKHFNRAVELDPNSALAYYGQSLVAAARASSLPSGVPIDAIMALEKTVALNADFARAWYDLASIYSRRPETLQRALDAARRAATLEPGETGYQYQVAAILVSLGRTEEARKAAEQLRNSSSDPRAADRAGELIAQMQPRTSAPAASASNSPISPPVAASASSPPPATSPGSVRIERKTEPDDKPVQTASRATRDESNPPPVVPAVVEGRVYSMRGTISVVNCADLPQMQITLRAQTIVMHLHAADFAKLAIKSSEASPAAGGTCTALRGRTARVSYKLVSGQKWDGEIQAIEFRSEP